jgi:hypothetical protein
VTAFFIPGHAGQARSTRDAYQAMRDQLQRQLGRAPRQRRIVELWARRGSVDCVTIVGQPDPICGDLVMAIFDMGPHQPFVVCHQRGEPGADVSNELLADSAYTVSEFDA